MADPHKHHFIPRFYQRGFVPGRGHKIWVYERGVKPRQRSVRSVGMQIDLYAFERAGKVDFATVEKELALLEDQASRIIQKLESGGSVTDKERARLSRFVSVMWRRTPKHMDHVNKTSIDFVPDVFAPLEQLEDQMSPEVKDEVKRLKEKYSNQAPSLVFAHNILRDSVFEDVMYSMDWGFFLASQGKSFLTSDDPVMFSKGSGLGSPDAIVAFPLSSRLLLQCMRKSNWGNRFHELEPGQVDYFNLCTVQNAHKQILASQKSEAIDGIIKEHLGDWNRE